MMNTIDTPQENRPAPLPVAAPQPLESLAPPPPQADAWQEPREGLYYHPQRLGDQNQEEVLALVRRFMRPMPVQITYSQGYLCTTAEDDTGITLQLLAADYDVDIDHKLDAMRTHRSRVNLLTAITPIGIDRNVELHATGKLQVYTPFNQEAAEVTATRNGYRITLPENCSYAVCYFPKEER